MSLADDFHDIDCARGSIRDDASRILQMGQAMVALGMSSGETVVELASSIMRHAQHINLAQNRIAAWVRDHS